MQTLREAMTKNLKTVPHYVTVQETARRMQAEKVGSLLVERGGQIVGIVTETDLVRKAVAKGSDLRDRKSTRLNSSHGYISYAVFCLKKKKKNKKTQPC